MQQAPKTPSKALKIIFCMLLIGGLFVPTLNVIIIFIIAGLVLKNTVFKIPSILLRSLLVVDMLLGLLVLCVVLLSWTTDATAEEKMLGIIFSILCFAVGPVVYWLQKSLPRFVRLLIAFIPAIAAIAATNLIEG